MTGRLAGHAARLRAALDRFVALRPRVEAWTGDQPPWGSEWTPREVLAHTAEMLSFWLGELERVLEGPTEPVPFGRVMTDPVRVLLIQRDRAVPVRELYARIASEAERAAVRLDGLTEAEAARRGLHPTRGEMAVEGLVEEFLSGHLEGHGEQLAATLGGTD